MPTAVRSPTTTRAARLRPATHPCGIPTHCGVFTSAPTPSRIHRRTPANSHLLRREVHPSRSLDGLRLLLFGGELRHPRREFRFRHVLKMGGDAPFVDERVGRHA